MARFYEHPVTGALRIAMPAGGAGGGGTGEFDTVATEKHKADYPRELSRFMQEKAEAQKAAEAAKIKEAPEIVEEEAESPSAVLSDQVVPQ